MPSKEAPPIAVQLGMPEISITASGQELKFLSNINLYS